VLFSAAQVASYIEVAVFETLPENFLHSTLMLLFNDARGSRENPKSTFTLASIRGIAGLEQCAEQLLPDFACRKIFSLCLASFRPQIGLTVVGVLPCDFCNRVSDLVPNVIQLLTSQSLQ
jgi:hypothetical protein